MPASREHDPYTPPPMHHDRSGAVLRAGLLAVMLGAIGLGYAWYTQQPRTALAPEIAEEQQTADAGDRVAPESLPPAPAAAPAPQQRQEAPVERSPEPARESEPATTPAAPTPMTPVDMPPSGSAGSM